MSAKKTKQSANKPATVAPAPIPSPASAAAPAVEASASWLDSTDPLSTGDPGSVPATAAPTVSDDEVRTNACRELVRHEWAAGIANVVVWPSLMERFRKEVMGARLPLVEGRIQRSPEGIVHLVAERLAAGDLLLDACLKAADVCGAGQRVDHGHCLGRRGPFVEHRRIRDLESGQIADHLDRFLTAWSRFNAIGQRCQQPVR